MNFCPYCKCMRLPNGRCRNRECILGSTEQATIPQIEKIYELCEELEVNLAGKNPSMLTKTRASELITKLIKRKVNLQLQSEVEQ